MDDIKIEGATRARIEEGGLKAGIGV